MVKKITMEITADRIWFSDDVKFYFRMTHSAENGLTQFGTQVPPSLQFEGTFEYGTMTSGCTSQPRTAMAKFLTVQTQAIAGFSSCREVACYPMTLRMS